MALSSMERKRKQRANPEGYAKSRVVDWKAKGIKNATWGKFIMLLELQNYACPICNCTLDLSSCLDHNHETGEIRGVLCARCNLLEGTLDAISNENIVQKATAYRLMYPLKRMNENGVKDR